MANKVIIGILVVLVAFSGALGVYAYRMTGQIDDLGAQLVVFQEDEAARIKAVRDEVVTLSEDTASTLDAVEDRLETDRLRIDALVEDAARQAEEDAARIARVEAEVAGANTRIAGIKPGFEASAVYRAVISAVVQISDGTGTIGSGFIYDDLGHVVTAHHVIEDLSTIYVILADGRTSPATLVGSSELSDVAVLALDREFDLAPVPLADSSEISIGQPTVAIGSPLDLPGTVTAGIVSQLGRFEQIGEDSEARSVANLIQFDAPANFGNSGGPLFDAGGNVIGIIVARVGPDLGDGISYAVSANKVRRVADAIIADGSFVYPWLGVEVADLTPETATAQGWESIFGALIARVTPGGPAQTAGARDGDLITTIGGVVIQSVAGLTAYLGEQASPGDSVTMEVLRGTITVELTVVIGSR